jgi:hypothetical protein
LAPLHERLEHARAPVRFLDGQQPSSVYQILLRRSFLCAVPFFPVLLFRMFSSRGFRWKSFAWGLDRYWQAYGAYVAVRRWFRKQPPRAVVVANDHTFWPRILIIAAQAEGIPTIYIQHAPVTDRFPPLLMDYALLDGRHSLETYAKTGESQAIAFLIGMPRSDAHVSGVNHRTQARVVGFCLGQADLRERATTLIRYLAKNCPGLRYVIRLHPVCDAKTRDCWHALCEELGLDYSDSRTEHPFEFLSRVDAVIAGGSGIILEAALMNVTPIMYELKPGIPDWYGFAADGMCAMFSRPEPVAALLGQLTVHRPPVRNRMDYYCATIGTQHDGQSSELAAELIQRIADGISLPPAGWRELAGSPIAAYEPIG